MRCEINFFYAPPGYKPTTFLRYLPFRISRNKIWKKKNS